MGNKTESFKKAKKFFKCGAVLGIIIFLLSVLPVYTMGNSAPVGAGAILRSGFGARALGMGGAYVAIANDYSAPYWNPAGVTRADSIFLGGMRYDKFGLGLNLNYLSGGLKFSEANPTKNTLLPSLSLPGIKGLSLSGTYIGFSTEVRTLGPGDSEIQIIYGERSFMATTGTTLPVIGSVGLTGKYYDFSAPDAGLDGENAYARGFGFDLGYMKEPLENLRVGMAAFDLTGTEVEWQNTPSEPINIVPSRYSIGTSYKLGLNSRYLPEIISGDLLFSGQYSFGANTSNKLRAGIEYSLNLLSLRAGAVKPENNSAFFTAGGGVKVKFFSANLAWVQNNTLEGGNTTDTIVFSSEFQF